MTFEQRHSLPLRSALRPVALAAALLSAGTLLTACGGGSDDTAPPPAPPPAVAANVSQTVKVIDGAIRGATVCLDMNANGLCDSGEPSAVTAADGSATLTLPAEDAHKYPVLALVGTDAVDVDHGPVPVAFSMQAPADRPAVVSPLSTMVALQAAASGVGTAAAEQAVQEVLGLAVSPLADFTTSTAPGHGAAQAAARLLVLLTQQQATTTADAKAADGSELARADVARAIQQNLMTMLPSVAAALADPAVAQAGSPADQARALARAAGALNSSEGFTATSVAAAVAVAKMPPAPDDASSAPAAGMTLRWFSYTDAGNYNFRVFKASAAQNTVVAGKRKFTEYREQARAGNGVNTFFQQYGEGLNNWARNQVTWTGTEWFTCPGEHVHEATAWDSKGRSDSIYCKASKITNLRTARDISGMKMADVVAEIRAYPMKDTAGDFAAWGPDPVVHAARLAGAFPAGSKLHYYSGTDTALPDSYNTTTADVVFFYNAAVAGGNGTECNRVGSVSALRFQDDADLTLEKLTARMAGTPCIYNARSTPAGNVPNEWWGQSTIGLGDVATGYADTSGSAYFRSGVQSLRASFTSNNGVKYWLCLRRVSDGSPRNCEAAGTGRYSIDTQGDARVLRFADLPARAASLGYARIMVERHGEIWYGARSKPTSSKQIRPNLEASNALFEALGIPAAASGATLTADTLLRHYTPQQGQAGAGGTGTYSRGALAWMPNDNAGLVGAWSLTASDTPRAQSFFFFPDGSYVMTDPVGDVDPNSCGGAGYERGTYQYDAATRAFTGLGTTLDTNLCAGLHDTTSTVNNGFGPGVTLTLAADGKSGTYTNQDGTVTLFRQTR